MEHDDDVVSGAEETTRCRTFESDSVADGVSCCRSSSSGEGHWVGVEGRDHVVWVGECKGDHQPAIAAADHRHSLSAWRHRLLLGLAGDVQRVEGVGGDLMHLEVDEAGFAEHLEGELFTPHRAQPGTAFGQ